MSLNSQVYTPPTKHTGQVVTIQYLRAAAALGVLIFHGSGYRTGAAGVDIFFVISGFIMMSSASRREWQVGNFALHRIVRIVPMYWLITVALAGTAVILPSMFRRLRPHLAQFTMSLLFIPHLDSYGHPWPLVVQGWSLNLEVLFYAVFALSLALRRWRTGFLAAALAALALSSLVVPRDAALARTYCNPMFLEFLLGIIAGRLWLSGRLFGRNLAVAMIIAALAAFAATSVLHTDLAFALPQQPEWERVLVWGVPAFVLAVGVLSLEYNGSVRKLPIALLLGDASYCLYLVQGLINPPVAKLAGPYRLLVMLPLALSAAVALHIVVERPVTRRLRSWMARLGYA
jgi:exopolysaccharide production protein ExoZ